jgi:hypothetical protein
MRLPFLLSTLLLAGTQLFATNVSELTQLCPEATLQQYINSYGVGFGGGSCRIGQLAFNKFQFASFAVLSNGSNTVFGNITASDILIKPDATRSAFDFFPATNPNLFNRSVAPGQSERYLLAYSADPPPIIAGDELYLDPPVGPVYGTKFICADKSIGPSNGSSINDFVPGLSRTSYSSTTFTCSGGTPAYIIKTDGDPTTLNVQVRDQVIFDTAASEINVLLMLDYEPGNAAIGTNVTGFSGVEAPVILTTVPEPANALLMGTALIGIGALLRRRKR